MEEIPTAARETYDQRTLFEVVKRMMAKAPGDRFQTSDDLVQALEAGGGFAAVGLATAATKTIPSLAGARLAGAATTPLPRVAGGLGAGGNPQNPGRGGRTAGGGCGGCRAGAAGPARPQQTGLFFSRGGPPPAHAGGSAHRHP